MSSSSSSTTEPPFPAVGSYLTSIRESSAKLREHAHVQISQARITQLLSSPALLNSFPRLAASPNAHGLAFPLTFPSVLEELNFLSTISLLNFASGYRVELHKTTGRGAWDTIRALVFGMFISREELLNARGMKDVKVGTIAELMGVTEYIYVERPLEERGLDKAGVTINELGGPVYELVKLVTRTLNETGGVLVTGGYPDLGSFVFEALRNGERAGKAKAGSKVDVEVVLDNVVRAIPGFRDMAVVDGQPIYTFKKVLFLLHAIHIRFYSSSSSPTQDPIPDTSTLPVFADNVLPSLLIHLGIIDLSTASCGLSSPDVFPRVSEELTDKLYLDPSEEDKLVKADEDVVARLPKQPPTEGPSLNADQAYILRAASIDACEIIVRTARSLTPSTSSTPTPDWLPNLTTPDLDMWLWGVAKDRKDYRRLTRFALKDTVMF